MVKAWASGAINDAAPARHSPLGTPAAHRLAQAAMCLPGVPQCDPLNQTRSRAAGAPTVSRPPVPTTPGYPPRGDDHDCQGPRGDSPDVPAGAMADRAE